MTSSKANPDLIFGRYRLVKRVAIGGMGEIFLARQVGITDRFVILKSLLPELALQEDFVAQFLDEGRVASTLNHPNVVSVFEVGAWEGTFYLAMEFVDGETIADLMNQVLKRSERLALGVVLKVIADAATGLEHAHTAVASDGTPLAIVHRDVSPQNIMIRRDGVTKVVDFGIARAANRQARTATGVLKGKFAYMAPEQLEGHADARSDQYALGVVLWEMLASRRLFLGDQMQIIREIATRAIEPPSWFAPEVPPELDRVVLKMTNIDPGARFNTLGDVAELLDAIARLAAPHTTHTDVGRLVRELGGAGLATASTQENFVIDLGGESNTSPTRVTSKKRTAGRLLTGSVALAIVVGGGGLAWRASQSKTHEPPADRVVVAPIAPVAPIADSAPEPPPLEPASTPVVPKKSRERAPKVVTAHTASASAPQAAGALSVKTQPWSTVSLDGRYVGSTPIFELPLSAGAHRVRLVNKEAGISTDRLVTVKPGETLKLDLDLAPH